MKRSKHSRSSVRRSARKSLKAVRRSARKAVRRSARKAVRRSARKAVRRSSRKAIRRSARRSAKNPESNNIRKNARKNMRSNRRMKGGSSSGRQDRNDLSGRMRPGMGQDPLAEAAGIIMDGPPGPSLSQEIIGKYGRARSPSPSPPPSRKPRALFEVGQGVRAGIRRPDLDESISLFASDLKDVTQEVMGPLYESAIKFANDNKISVAVASAIIMSTVSRQFQGGLTDPTGADMVPP
jgi:hypothetical protein